MIIIKAHIIAELKLLPTEADGRLSSIAAGEYRGVLGIGSEYFSVRWFISENETLEPGGRARTFGVQFLFPETSLPNFRVGDSFTVWEGKTIGSGRVPAVHHE